MRNEALGLGRNWLALAALAGLLSACGGEDERGDDDDNSAGNGAAGNASAGSAGNGSAGTQAGAGSAGSAGTSFGGTAGVSGGSGGAQAGGSAGTATGGAGGAVALPNGDGLEYRGIVNIVNEEAAQALDDFILEADPFLGGSGELDLELATSIFYSHYADEYDFVYFATDHDLATSIRGLHASVNVPPLLGTGRERPYSSGTGPARMRAAIALVLRDFVDFPPFAHELMHNFGVELDPAFGFSRDRDSPFPGHWGMTGVDGQLGGFDPASLRCETPAGALPPNCTPNASGRYRYIVDPFAPNTIFSRATPYGPLELYLMGLLPAVDVPSPLLRFEDADYPFDNLEVTADEKLVIDASGLGEIELSDIIARHGEVPLLPANERHFTSAVVLVTRQPATQAYLDQVADWAAIWGGELTSTNPEWTSFATTTGGRATMTCRVGARRELGPDEYLDFSGPTYHDCNPTTQDCGAGLACYGTSDFYCAVPGDGPRNEPCETDSDCSVGLVCSISTLGDDYQCAPYCDHVNRTAAKGCDTLCPGNWTPIFDAETLDELGAFCFAGAGGACDPLAQDCPSGQACSGLEAPACQVVGTTPAGEVCLPFGETCEGGSVCVGIEGQEDFFCQPYCDSATDAPTAIACSTLCPGGAWEYDGYSVCIPD